MHLHIWATAAFLFLIGSAFSNSVVDTAAEETDASNLRIISGSPALSGQFPYVASILGPRSACVGSLIASSYVLTAAHCVSLPSTAMNDEIKEYKVYLDSVFLTGGGYFINNEQIQTPTRGVSKILVHESYSTIGTGYVNDIAILVLDHPVKTVPAVPMAVKTITKPALRDTYENSNAVITGWGLTSDGGDSSGMLKWATVKIFDNKLCAAMWGRLFNATTMMCAQGPTSSICVDDEGGPILVGKTQVGIASFFSSSINHCFDPKAPAVFTRLSAYSSWIKTTMAKNPPTMI